MNACAFRQSEKHFMILLLTKRCVKAIVIFLCNFLNCHTLECCSLVHAKMKAYGEMEDCIKCQSLYKGHRSMHLCEIAETVLVTAIQSKDKF